MTYKEYHTASMKAKDVDPSVICLKYLADRFELNLEQRYWLAFLYGTCYCAPTAFYIYNEFPDYQTTNVARLSKWWTQNKHRLIFQTDRLRIKSNNQFVESFISYKSLVGGSQQRYFQAKTWQELYKRIEAIKYFGRFTLFNYLDVLNQITDVNLMPMHLNMVEAESCRKGLCYAIGRDELVDQKLTYQNAVMLHEAFINVLNENEGNIFQIETTLCAYKKYRWGKRYVGFYIDRMYSEISQMQINVPVGVEWNCLWQFRSETFEQKYMREWKQ